MAPLRLEQATRALFPFIVRIFADAGYQGPRFAQAAANTGSWIVEIVKRNELHKFVILPKAGSSKARWHGSAATAAWRAIRALCHNRRRLHPPRHDRIMLRRLTRSTACPCFQFLGSALSDPAHGAGNVQNDPGITGLTDAQLKSALPRDSILRYGKLKPTSTTAIPISLTSSHNRDRPHLRADPRS